MLLPFILHVTLNLFVFKQNEKPAFFASTPSQISEMNYISHTTYVKNSGIDTIRNPDSAKISGTYYVIAGSFLIPRNAENQVRKLQKLGFQKCYKFNFPETEFYSVVVDTFQLLENSMEITEKLQMYKVDYFVKNY